MPLVMALFLDMTGWFGDAMDVGHEDQKWPEYVVAYAKEKGIEMAGPFGIEKDVARYDTGRKLPVRRGNAGVDRFGFKKVVSFGHALPFIPVFEDMSMGVCVCVFFAPCADVTSPPSSKNSNKTTAAGRAPPAR